MTILQNLSQFKITKSKSFGMKLARAPSYNGATPVPHPTRPGRLGGFVRFSRAPEKRAFEDLSPSFRALFRTKCAGQLGFHHMIRHGQRISGVPGGIRKGARLRCRLPGGKSRQDSKFWNSSYESKISVWYF